MQARHIYGVKSTPLDKSKKACYTIVVVTPLDVLLEPLLRLIETTYPLCYDRLTETYRLDYRLILLIIQIVRDLQTAYQRIARH